jgi:hypothetical protein
MGAACPDQWKSDAMLSQAAISQTFAWRDQQPAIMVLTGCDKVGVSQ